MGGVGFLDKLITDLIISIHQISRYTQPLLQHVHSGTNMYIIMYTEEKQPTPHYPLPCQSASHFKHPLKVNNYSRITSIKDNEFIQSLFNIN